MTEIRKERILKIRCEMTPSHQSDLLDTLMCKFEPLAGKEVIIHGDYHHARYRYNYKKDEPLTLINSFKIDIRDFLEKGGRIESMENRIIFDFPMTVLNKGDKGESEPCLFPLFVCSFEQDDKDVDVKCYIDYKNEYKDLEAYKKEFPNLIEYL